MNLIGEEITIKQLLDIHKRSKFWELLRIQEDRRMNWFFYLEREKQVSFG